MADVRAQLLEDEKAEAEAIASGPQEAQVLSQGKCKTGDEAGVCPVPQFWMRQMEIGTLGIHRERNMG